MHGTGSATFTLHFLHEHGFAKHIFATLSRPVVHVFCHGRRRSDGVDSRYFAKHISDVRSRLVTITSNEFFSHNTFLDYDCYV